MAVQYYAIVPVNASNWKAAEHPVENAAALVYGLPPAIGFSSFRPRTGWKSSPPCDVDTVIGYGDDTAVKITRAEAALVLRRLDPTAKLPA